MYTDALEEVDSKNDTDAGTEIPENDSEVDTETPEEIDSGNDSEADTETPEEVDSENDTDLKTESIIFSCGLVFSTVGSRGTRLNLSGIVTGSKFDNIMFSPAYGIAFLRARDKKESSHLRAAWLECKLLLICHY